MNKWINLLSCVSRLAYPLGQDGADPDDELLVDLDQLHEVLAGVLRVTLHALKNLITEHIAPHAPRCFGGGVNALVLQV